MKINATIFHEFKSRGSFPHLLNPFHINSKNHSLLFTNQPEIRFFPSLSLENFTQLVDGYWISITNSWGLLLFLNLSWFQVNPRIIIKRVKVGFKKILHVLILFSEKKFVWFIQTFLWIYKKLRLCNQILLDLKKLLIVFPKLFNLKNCLVETPKDSVKSNKTLDNCILMHLFYWSNQIFVASTNIFSESKSWKKGHIL